MAPPDDPYRSDSVAMRLPLRLGICLGYLTIIDTACPSLSDRVGKVPDSAQRAAASFVLLPLASFFARFPE
jgi:hypothetical protein